MMKLLKKLGNPYLVKSSLLIISLVTFNGCTGGNTNSSTSSNASSEPTQTTSSQPMSSEQSSSSSSVMPTDLTAYNNADGINGGRLYSKFWAEETGFDLDNSKLASQNTLDNIANKSDFFRCKQCHGWDRLGQDGGYSNRAPSTTRPNVADADLVTISTTLSEHQLFNSIKTGDNRRAVTENLDTYNPNTNSEVGDRMPDYGSILTDEQIWDLVKYLKEEALDTSELYTLVLSGGTYPNRDRSFTEIGGNGNAFNGDQLYRQKCSMCHGDDGTKILVDGESYTVGAHMRAKPYEDQHKVKFGHLGSIMGPVLAESSVDQIRDLFKALSNDFNYPNEQKVVETVDGSRLFGDYCAGCHSANGMGNNVFGDIKGRSVNAINSAINRVELMGNLSTLDASVIQAIADVIK